MHHLFLYFVPLLGTLAVLFTFLIARHEFGWKVGILSALILSVFFPHVCPSSQARPAVLAQLIMLITIFSFIKMDKNKAYLIIFLTGSVLIPFSHALTTYFLLITLVFYTIVDGLRRRDAKSTVIKIVLLAFIVPVNIWYLTGNEWGQRTLSAISRSFTTFNPMKESSLIVMILILIVTLAILFARRRRRKEGQLTWTRWLELGFTLTIIALLLLYFRMHPIKGVGFQVSDALFLFILPTAILSSIGILGVRVASDTKSLTWSWSMVILLSMMVSWIEGFPIPPFRHGDYIAMPLSILIALGMIHLVMAYRHRIIRGILVASLGFLITLSAIMQYPDPEILSNFTERYTFTDKAGVDWVKQNLAMNLIGTDYRMGTVIQGFTVLDYYPAAWVLTTDNPERFDKFVKANPRIWFLIDQKMLDGQVIRGCMAGEQIGEGVITRLEKLDKMYDNGDVILYSTLRESE